MEQQHAATPTTGLTWNNPNGRNEQHQATGQFKVFDQVQADATAELAKIKNKPYAGCAKDKRTVIKKRKHAQRKRAQRGINHSMKPKGGCRRR